MGDMRTQFDRLLEYFGAAGRSDIEEKCSVNKRTYDIWKYRGDIPIRSLLQLAKKEKIENPEAWAFYIKTGQGEFFIESRKEGDK